MLRSTTKSLPYRVQRLAGCTAIQARHFTWAEMAYKDQYYNEYWDRNKKSQWDGGEDITDKDRHREMYFDWANTTSRALHPGRFGSVGNARKRYRNCGWGEQLEFQRIMRSICQGNYLNLTEEQMRAGCLGYMSEDDEFMTREEDEFGVPYYKASPIYRNAVLEDQCEGRPTYEWQIPAGADRYYGYKTVSSAVDISYTDAINENDIYDWELTEEQIGMKGKHFVLENRTTDAKIVLCTINDAQEAMDKFSDTDTFAVNLAADTLLQFHDSLTSPKSKDHTDVFQLTVGWSVFSYMFYPQYFAFCSSLAVIQFLRTWCSPTHIRNKRLLKLCRDRELHVVLGDWLTPDWIERELHTSDHDIGTIAERYNMFGVGNDSARGTFMVEGNSLKAAWYKFLIDLELRGIINSRYNKMSTEEEFEKEMYPKTYGEAVQDKRLDIFAHTVNNMETQRAVVAVRETVDVTADLALLLVQKRLTGDIPVSVPLQYMEEHERVSVVWQ